MRGLRKLGRYSPYLNPKHGPDVKTRAGHGDASCTAPLSSLTVTEIGMHFWCFFRLLYYKQKKNPKKGQ